MNRLSTERRAQVLGSLVEGTSILGTSRITGVAKNTITSLLVDIGDACSEYQDGVLSNLHVKRIECDEIWSYCYAKQKNVPDEFQGTPGYGDVWTWTAIDADTKLVPTWLVGERTLADCYTFIADLGSRILGGFQLTTDGLSHYATVVEPLLRDRVDYAVLHKIYADVENRQTHERRTVCTGVNLRPLVGNPDLDLATTSYVERQNLTMRMGMRRFTRLTNGFSKKVENHAHAVSLHFMYYNFCRPHGSLKLPNAKKRTPAMAAGIANYPWSLAQVAGLLD